MVDDPVSFQISDQEFHSTIYAACGNALALARRRRRHTPETPIPLVRTTNLVTTALLTARCCSARSDLDHPRPTRADI